MILAQIGVLFFAKLERPPWPQNDNDIGLLLRQTLNPKQTTIVYQSAYPFEQYSSKLAHLPQV